MSGVRREFTGALAAPFYALLAGRRVGVELLVVGSREGGIFGDCYLHWEGDLVPIFSDMSLKILLFLRFCWFCMVEEWCCSRNST